MLASTTIEELIQQASAAGHIPVELLTFVSMSLMRTQLDYTTFATTTLQCTWGHVGVYVGVRVCTCACMRCIRAHSCVVCVCTRCIRVHTSHSCHVRMRSCLVTGAPGAHALLHVAPA